MKNLRKDVETELSVEYLFAYGFLMRAFHRSKRTATPKMDVEYISDGWVYGTLYQVGDYPGIVLKSGQSKVYGEVFRLMNRMQQLHDLDFYEHASPLISEGYHYRRVLHPVHTTGNTIHCWIYEYAKETDSLEVITSGRFLS